MIKKIICLILLHLCISCSNNNNLDIDKNKDLLSEPENLYRLANYFHYLMKQFNQK